MEELHAADRRFGLVSSATLSDCREDCPCASWMLAGKAETVRDMNKPSIWCRAMTRTWTLKAEVVPKFVQSPGSSWPRSVREEQRRSVDSATFAKRIGRLIG